MAALPPSPPAPSTSDFFPSCESLYNHVVTTHPKHFIYIETRELLSREAVRWVWDILVKQVRVRVEPLKVYIVSSFWMSAGERMGEMEDNAILERFVEMVQVLIGDLRRVLFQLLGPSGGPHDVSEKLFPLPVVIGYHRCARELVVIDDDWCGFCNLRFPGNLRNPQKVAELNEMFVRSYGSLTPRNFRIKRWNELIFCGMSSPSCPSQSIVSYLDNPASMETIHFLLAILDNQRDAVFESDDGRHLCMNHSGFISMKDMLQDASGRSWIEKYPFQENPDGSGTVVISREFLPPRLRQSVRREDVNTETVSDSDSGSASSQDENESPRRTTNRRRVIGAVGEKRERRTEDSSAFDSGPVRKRRRVAPPRSFLVPVDEKGAILPLAQKSEFILVHRVVPCGCGEFAELQLSVASQSPKRPSFSRKQVAVDVGGHAAFVVGVFRGPEYHFDDLKGTHVVLIRTNSTDLSRGSIVVSLSRTCRLVGRWQSALS